jgi:hypothetical protein
MEHEPRPPDLDPDDGAIEPRGPQPGTADGAGAGTPGGPEAYPDAPGEGPTADEATGPTGDPDEA